MKIKTIWNHQVVIQHPACCIVSTIITISILLKNGYCCSWRSLGSFSKISLLAACLPPTGTPVLLAKFWTKGAIVSNGKLKSWSSWTISACFESLLETENSWVVIVGETWQQTHLFMLFPSGVQQIKYPVLSSVLCRCLVVSRALETHSNPKSWTFFSLIFPYFSIEFRIRINGIELLYSKHELQTAQVHCPQPIK